MKSNLEILLGEWGIWKAREEAQSLGYPSHAAFTEERVDSQRRVDITDFIVDEPLRKVDAIIQASHPDILKVITAHYKWTGSSKAKIERLHVSKTWFYNQLETAHHMIGYALGGKFAMVPVILVEV